MENNNIFLWIKVLTVGVMWAFSEAFGWLGWLVVAWIICMGADYLSGSAAACKDGKWSSAQARAGLWHKAGMIVVVSVSAVADGVLGNTLNNLPVLEGAVEYAGLLLPMTLGWYILTELGSVLENANALGAPLPGFLVKALATAQEILEEKAE